MMNEMNYRYMMDTNMVSHLIRGSVNVCKRIQMLSMSDLCISAITEGELLFGLAKKPEAKQLKNLVHEFLIRVDILPWDSAAADCYGKLRAFLHTKGLLLGNLDLLIAAHALASDLTLVTNDKAFSQVKGLKTEDWY